jgi:hypothetical protein
MRIDVDDRRNPRQPLVEEIGFLNILRHEGASLWEI